MKSLARSAESMGTLRPTIERFWPLFILLVIVLLHFARPDVSMSNMPPTRQIVYNLQGSRVALPHPIAITLVHYATTNITPQQTREEMMVTASILSRRGPCNFLVYGLGFDSPLWQALNYGGRTVFLEEDLSWIAQMVQAHPSLEAYAVNYTTMLSEADDLLAYAREHREICLPEQNLVQSECKLVLKTLPDQIYRIKWDVILIDAPRGYSPEFPGRMTAIYTSALMARAAARDRSMDILLHDVDRSVEKMYSTEFFCARNLIESVGKLWHFQIFGEGTSPRKEFCMSSSFQRK